MRFIARLVTYDKPDAQGDVFRRFVRWDDLKGLVGFEFQSVAGGNVAGKVLKVREHPEGVDAVLEFKESSADLVPVIAFTVQGFRTEGGARVIENAQLVAVSMVARDKAILPADFFFENDPEPSPRIEIRKVKP